MKFFLDTANLDEIKRIEALGLLDGVTTNPSLIAKEGKNFESQIKAICEIVKGPVSAEVISTEMDGMVEEARRISKWADNIVVKIPMTEAGLGAINILSKEGIRTNCTLIFSLSQGLLAMKAGADYISPFMGRIDDMGESGLDLIYDLVRVIENYGFESEIIAASIRNIGHLEGAAAAGAHIATVPGSLFPKLWQHPLTDKGLKDFIRDWEEYEKGMK